MEPPALFFCSNRVKASPTEASRWRVKIQHSPSLVDVAVVGSNRCVTVGITAVGAWKTLFKAVESVESIHVLVVSWPVGLLVSGQSGSWAGLLRGVARRWDCATP